MGKIKDPTTLEFTITVTLGYDAACSILSKTKPGTEVEITSEEAGFHIFGKATAEITHYPAGICPGCHADYRNTGKTKCTNCGEEVPQ